ncbi:MAG TPA: bifunctional (p)ppGpp synthetase/guanosine-3',5'-bis(diphosphate) 3'-pyrophosphohydrolase [Erysipelotrichaceae bacterium]|nr:bifunctional (p)ppGpp synthetase/guanosine-3',5'-bis(diphosphate) 3'-pyrophosphohydrolase [Erysipelotrichaceae bacterium]
MRNQDNMTFEDIMYEARQYITKEDDLALIKKAYDFAQKMHKGQYRKSGEPYVIHVIQVGYILATLHVGPKTIAAGLLHDVIEDTDITNEEFIEIFGKEIYSLVEGVTKIGNLEFNDLKEYQAENHRKIFIAMAKDIRVILIKLVDRLHNMRTLEHMPEDKQKRIAQETLDVYSPIAHRLGMFEIKNELEDMCFFYLDKERYYEIAKMVEKRRTERDEYVEKMILNLKSLLDKQDLRNFDIFGRSKHLHSINKKMQKKNIRFDEILDLLAIRVITNTELECYEVLGYIHQKYTPVPGRLKDYIAMPKFNMYQSLHTTVVGENGNIFEIQIRTKEMDDIAENGVAAHWRYKEGSNYNPKTEQAEIEEKLHWFRDLIDLKDDKDINDATEFMEHLQEDLFNTSVYVMSPQGRVIDLPVDSTPIDFAYRIHTEVGHQAVGAVVNGSLVPLNTKLKTGDVVQINTSKNSPGPNQDWLAFVKTSTAKSRIRSFINRSVSESREPYIDKGRETYRKELKERDLDDKISSKQLLSAISHFSLNSLDDFYYAIGTKSISLTKVFEKLSKQARSEIDPIKRSSGGSKRKKSVSSSKYGVEVEGLDSMMINLGQCCYPVKGDDIVGYITKGKGVTIHRENCSNIASAKKRLIACEWIDDGQNHQYESVLKILSTNRNYLLTDIVTVISQYKASINEINSKVMPDQINAITVANLNVSDLSHLNNIISNLRKVDSVYSLERQGELSVKPNTLTDK